MLNSGYQAFIAIMDVLFIEVATILPNLVKIGQNLRERHQLFKLQDGGSRYLEFWWTLVGIGNKITEWHKFSEIQHGGRRHFEKYSAGWTAILRF